MTIRELIDRVPEEKWDYHLIIEVPEKDCLGLFSNIEALDWIDKVDDSTRKITLGY